MTRLTSDKPTGDFLKFPYRIDDSLHTYKMVPNTADGSVPVNLSITQCIDLVKCQGSTDVSIYLHSEYDSIPAQDGYLLEQVQGGIDTRKASKPYILTNRNGHFYIPISSKSLLHDLVEFLQNTVGYVGIRVVPYAEQHSIDFLANTTQKKLNEIRRKVVTFVTESVGEKQVRKRIEKDHPKKGGEFDRHGNEMVEKMREYASLELYSVCLFAGPEDDAFVQGHTYDSAIKSLDRLQFIPIKPVKEKAGWFKKVNVDPIDVIGAPLYFNIRKINKKCSDRYYSDSLIRKRLHSPIICIPSDLRFPFSHPSIAKTAPNKRTADRVNDDEDFFGSGGTS